MTSITTRLELRLDSMMGIQKEHTNHYLWYLFARNISRPIMYLISSYVSMTKTEGTTENNDLSIVLYMFIVLSLALSIFCTIYFNELKVV